MTRRGIRACVLLAASWLCAAVAQGAPLGDNTVRLAPSTFKLPQNIGPLRYSGEDRYSDRRMGRAFTYNAGGISLKIYVYDHGICAIPDGPDSVAACEQFESAKREIERGGNYQNVFLRGEFSRAMVAAHAAPVAREAVYEFDRNGIHAVSALWVTAADGYFFKLRLSLRAEIARRARGSARSRFSTQAHRRRVVRAPGRRRRVPRGSRAGSSPSTWKPPPTPRPPPRGLLMPSSSRASPREHPETRPPCGGGSCRDSRPNWRRAQAALREYRRTRAGDADV